jgi:copper chaperone
MTVGSRQKVDGKSWQTRSASPRKRSIASWQTAIELLLMGRLDLPMVGNPTSTWSHPLETTMYEFEIQNMTCGHCASTIEKAIKAADPNAAASIDLVAKIARVDTNSNPAVINAAIVTAGYPSTFKQI